MPAAGPVLTPQAAETIAAIGAAIRRRRKELRISAVAAAQAAGISRVTLHRLEKGEPSVTMGAYMGVVAALGMDAHVAPRGAPVAATQDRKGWIPARVRLADYPKLKELAWQVHGVDELTPREALDIYERNSRHLDLAALSTDESDLIDALRRALGSDNVV
jgi:transcriptional regulator with XRE-family HTH domain